VGSPGSGYKPMADSCKLHNEALSFIKAMAFFRFLTSKQLVYECTFKTTIHLIDSIADLQK
jgi:hypothetical protein